jgi:acetyl-CoA/propionyl-CoA carboxylase, biotin carboxylase, biotin carboxyl carrier protein
MFSRVLIANRGEIAVRIARTCRELGVESVALHSDVDARARHVALADLSVRLEGVAPSDTYLNENAILAAAAKTGAEAVHPGYGFLSESAAFAQAVIDRGLAWVGPSPEAMRMVGDKISARRVAESAGVPVVPGITEPVDEAGIIEEFARDHGYPVAIKAAGGGGGRGLKVVASREGIAEGLASARREAVAYFGSSDVFVERFLPAPKHLEVQVLAPAPGEALWLGVRDCSLQRRHQKLVEETPPGRWGELATPMGEAAVALAKACGYVGAGTMEFLLDDHGAFYFLEVNARLQVEHTVTEEVLGLDLVACQLRIACGEPIELAQPVIDPRGWAIECRINAEDPGRGFAPTPGRLTRFIEPGGLGVRVDSGYEQGDEVPAAYDSLIAKLICRAPSREQARARMLRALREMEIEGVATTIPAHELLLQLPSFVSGTHTTRTVEDEGALATLERPTHDASTEGVLVVDGRPVKLWNPAMSAWAAGAVHAGASTDVVAPMQGTIVQVLVSEGDAVDRGAALMILEAMKMETTISAARAGRVTSIMVARGQSAGAGQVVAVVE